MIKANELRIGNYCLDKVSGEWLLVDELTKSEDKHVVGFYVVNRDKFPLPNGWQAEYVPLTPEILEKAGFTKDGDGVFVIRKCWYWIQKNESEGLLQIALGYAPICNSPCTYLHQLQNLYFALTGEELPIQS